MDHLRGESRNRSKSLSERPTPKPRSKPRQRTNSILQSGRSSTAGSVSAGSSPLLSREAKNSAVLKPTPLVVALTKQLVNQLSVQGDGQRQESDDKSKSTHKPMSPLSSEEAKKPEKAPASSNSHAVGSRVVGSDFMEGVSEKNLKLPAENSPILRRPRSKTVPPRPPPPSYPPPPNPRLNRLISENRAANSKIHVIDSRSKTPPPPPRHTPQSQKTTKYGTPPPKRPAPPPPQKKSSEPPAEQQAPSPAKSLAAKPQTPPIPKPRSLLHINKSSQSPTTGSKAERQTNKLKVSKANKKVEDAIHHDYEDLDTEIDHYEFLGRSSSSEDEEEICRNSSGGLLDSQGDIPPELPPKNEAKIVNEGKELPPLPPRTRQGAKNKRHHLLNFNVKSERKDKSAAAIQDSGSYEPIDCQNTDSNSDGSQDSYTEMNDPFHKTCTEEDLEADEPEPVYITMDPHEFIPPPNNYKPNNSSAMKANKVQ